MDRGTVTKSPRMAGGVRRYHTWPTIQTQTNADHSFHVMRIYLQIWGEPPEYVTTFVLLHDLGEMVTGDLPFPVKRRNANLKVITDFLESEAVEDMGLKWPLIPDTYRQRVKICDLLEMTEFAAIELSMGNKFAVPIYEDTLAAALELATKENCLASVEAYVSLYIEPLEGI